MFTKPRFEFKYITSLDTMAALQERLNEAMIPDPNADNGGYHVNSLYYDTPDLNCYCEKIDGNLGEHLGGRIIYRASERPDFVLYDFSWQDR